MKTVDIKKTILKGIRSGKLAFKRKQEICAALRIDGKQKRTAAKALDELVDEGELIYSDGFYGTPQQFGAFVGTVRANAHGFAFVTPEGKNLKEDDYFVPARKLGGALDRDKVLAVPVKGTDDEAMVIKILDRGMKRVTGRFERDKRAGYVLPDSNTFDSDVFIPLSLCAGAQSGDKVVAEITSYPHGKMVGGKIVEILGKDGDFAAEELAIIRSYNLREEFPPQAEAEAQRVAAQPVVLGERRDLRDLLTITIDGDDTRDIDDAVSLEIKDGNYILGVHIADVSHYVKLNGDLDREAYARGTSVYFPDRVLPMLPKALSNGACSLNEGEDRYAMSCVMTFGKNGEKLGCEIFQSVIRSDKRMTYNGVTKILGGDVSPADGSAEIVAMLKSMEALCLLLEKRRRERGEVSLDVKEAHIYVDEDGEIVIPPYERALSHRMIEQFMVSANETVAEFAEKRKAPFMYRIHESPAPEKAGTLFSFARDLGLNARGDVNNVHPQDFQRILTMAEGKPYASVINRVMLRSMQKARYSEDNPGHFGLASDCYCHFTSPIRRYPDLFVHRVLKELLRGDDERAKKLYAPKVKEGAINCSECERQADAAERDVDDLYKVVYMSDRIGEEYDAVISGVIATGLFAELPNTIEGMIRIESMPQDDYEFYEDKFLLKGTHRAYRIGDAVRVKVAGCDFGTMKVQFILV